MQRTIWLKLSILVSLCGCLPPRPKVDICDIDQLPIKASIEKLAEAVTPEEKIRCLYAVMNSPLLHCSDGDKKQYTLTLEQADKFIAMSPAHVQSMLTYIVEVEKMVLELQKSK